MKPVWSVRHRTGWCATRTGRQHNEEAFSVKTLCGYTIALPWGSEKRVPDCPDCLAFMRPKAGKRGDAGIPAKP